MREREAGRQAGRLSDRQRVQNWKTGGEIKRARRKDRQAGRQTFRQTDSQTETDRESTKLEDRR